jgi:hypothetical protein
LGNSDKMRRYAPICLTVLLVGFGTMNASADDLYNSIPVSMTANVAIGNTPNDFTYSMPFVEDNVSSFGGLINTEGPGFASGGVVALSDWATAAMYATYIGANPVSCGVGGCTGANASGYYTNVTVSVYTPGASSTLNGDTVYAVGAPIATETTNAFIAWRPAPDLVGGFACTDGQTSFANPSTGNEQCGEVNLVDFNLNATLPVSVIYQVSISTGTDGSGNPLPSDSLNFGINPFAPTAGSDPQPDTAYYACTGASGLGPAVACDGTIHADTGWASIGEGAIEFSPEPATFGLIGFGLLGLGIVARKKGRKS